MLFRQLGKDVKENVDVASCFHSHATLPFLKRPALNAKLPTHERPTRLPACPRSGSPALHAHPLYSPAPTLNLNVQRRIRVADIPETDAFPHPKRRQPFSNKGIPEQLRELSLISQNTPVEVMTDPEPGFLLQCIQVQMDCTDVPALLGVDEYPNKAEMRNIEV
jgi:hypothetical protein|nr:hypothetical protein [Salinibacter ruber]